MYKRQNYHDCFEKVKKELNSWHHRFLSVFGKITVIKTMCIPKFTHIATVIPNLSIRQIKDIEREFELFLNNNNPSVTDKTTRYTSKKELALGMIKVDYFWMAVKMSWLRRLSFSKSTWALLHKAETKLYTFNPMYSNWSEI